MGELEKHITATALPSSFLPLMAFKTSYASPVVLLRTSKRRRGGLGFACWIRGVLLYIASAHQKDPLRNLLSRQPPSAKSHSATGIEGRGRRGA